MTKHECNRLKNNYKSVKAPAGEDKDPVYVPKEHSNDEKSKEKNVYDCEKDSWTENNRRED